MYDPREGNRVYHEYMDQLEYAESLGFDGIGVNEHHQNGYGLMPSPNLIAASLARRTSKAKLVVLGNSVALYDPPIRVAEEMAIAAGIPVPKVMVIDDSAPNAFASARRSSIVSAATPSPAYSIER